MSRTFKLYRLQEADSKIDAANNRKNEILAVLANDSAILAAQEALGQAQGDFDEAEKTLKQAEQLTQAQRLKIKQTEDRLYSGTVTNPKELQDLQQEGEALRRYLDTLEERQLETMMSADDFAETRDARANSLDQAKGDRIAAHAELNGEHTRLTGELERWTEERKTTSVGIEKTDLDTYERIRSKRKGIAVARVSNGICGACGTQLNSKLHQEARQVEHIAFCDNCRRILYVG
jgi:hypothetical protein